MAVTDAPALVRTRLTGLDAARGLAVLLMVLDHALLVFDGPQLLRTTVGRVAMPLFFIVAGSLVRRLTWRHAGIAVLGLGLPLWVTWVDNWNVLFLYVLGAAAIVGFRYLSWPVWLLVVPALAFMANGWNLNVGTSFDVLAAVALMALGQLLGAAQLHHAFRYLPRPLELVGRYPLRVYVGHLLVLDFVGATIGASAVMAA